MTESIRLFKDGKSVVITMDKKPWPEFPTFPAGAILRTGLLWHSSFTSNFSEEANMVRWMLLFIGAYYKGDPLHEAVKKAGFIKDTYKG